MSVNLSRRKMRKASKTVRWERWELERCKEKVIGEFIGVITSAPTRWLQFK